MRTTQSTPRPTRTRYLSTGKTAALGDDPTPRGGIDSDAGECPAANYFIYTDEYNIYGRLEEWGYEHQVVCHSKGEYARDEDQDGFHEVHVNTMEGFWSLLRYWLRPHRGLSQEKLPLYLGFSEFMHNMRKRGKALLELLIQGVLGVAPWNP